MNIFEPVLIQVLLRTLLPNSKFLQELSVGQIEEIQNWVLAVIKEVQSKFAGKPNEEKHEQAVKQMLSKKAPFASYFNLTEADATDLIKTYVPIAKKTQ